MNKSVPMASIAILAATVSIAAGAAELRPTQVIMQARAGWMKAMGESLAAGKLADVARDARDLSAQTERIAANLQGERKELTQKVSALAKTAGESAAMGDAAAVKVKLGEIKGTCANCHEKYRDKK